MKNQTIEQAVEEIPTNKCPVCDGDGCTVEHDPNDPTGQTPIQVQCDFCHAEGKITTLDCAREALQAQREAMRQETMRTVMAHCRKLVDKPEEAIYLGQIEEMLYELDQEYLTPPTK